ncbi:hypothetical protein Esti_003977 [Eimeria stiedai]
MSSFEAAGGPPAADATAAAAAARARPLLQFAAAVVAAAAGAAEPSSAAADIDGLTVISLSLWTPRGLRVQSQRQQCSTQVHLRSLKQATCCGVSCHQHLRHRLHFALVPLLQAQVASTRGLLAAAVAAAEATAAAVAIAEAGSSSSSSAHTLEGEAIQGHLQPLRGMVLLEKLEAEQKTQGGLLLPSECRKEQHVGRVLSVGPGEFQPETGRRIESELKAGDLVVFSRHSGDSLKYDGAECLLLAASEVLAKVTEPQSLKPENVSPLGDAVFVRILKPAEKSAGGLLLLPQQQERVLQQAEVVAVGPGRLNKQMTRIPTEVGIGDRVVYSTYAEDGSQLKVGDRVYAFVRASDIAAKW